MFLFCICIVAIFFEGERSINFIFINFIISYWIVSLFTWHSRCTSCGRFESNNIQKIYSFFTFQLLCTFELIVLSYKRVLLDWSGFLTNCLLFFIISLCILGKVLWGFFVNLWELNSGSRLLFLFRRLTRWSSQDLSFGYRYMILKRLKWLTLSVKLMIFSYFSMFSAKFMSLWLSWRLRQHSYVDHFENNN